MHGPGWRKAPPELVDRFHETVAGVDGVEIRKMFGYPAGFIGGNMAFGLHQDSFVVRLPDAERTARLDDGWAQFEPMPGRPMREYVVIPAAVVDDVDEARAWIERAAGYVRTLPAKEAKPRRP
jgi:TfoX/Sxy family transcriptional regulator of competence genes